MDKHAEKAEFCAGGRAGTAAVGAEGFPQKQKPFWGKRIRESGSYAVIWNTAAVVCVRKREAAFNCSTFNDTHTSSLYCLHSSLSQSPREYINITVESLTGTTFNSVCVCVCALVCKRVFYLQSRSIHVHFLAGKLRRVLR